MKGLARLPRLGLAGLLLAASLGTAAGHAAPAKAPVNLLFWSWVPHLQDEVNLFNKSHSDIQVKLVNVAQGGPEYTKLRTALKAGTGAPDVVQIEFQYLPTFEILNGLVDISAYGANAVKERLCPLDLGPGQPGQQGLRHPARQRPHGPALPGRHFQAI